MGYRCLDGMCGADDCERCGYPEPEEVEEPDFDDEQEPQRDEFIERCGVQI